MVGAILGRVDGTRDGESDTLGLWERGEESPPPPSPPFVARGTATAMIIVTMTIPTSIITNHF